jgi:Ca2+-binding RTX toxin-like protein
LGEWFCGRDDRTADLVILNLIYDASVANAPVGFTAAMTSVVNFFENNFSNPVTVNIAVGWGEVNGQALRAGALGESISYLQPTTYGSLTAALAATATSPADLSSVASLPAADPTTAGAFWLTQAEAKVLGMATAGGLDGFVGFSSVNGIFDFQQSDLITTAKFDFFATAIHEISEIIGRQTLDGMTLAGQPNSYEPLDLFHFTGPGARTFVGPTAGYFSADNGATNLDNFNTLTNGDFGDWAASAGHDAFLAFSSSGVINIVSAADMTVLDVLGWTVTPRADLTVRGVTVSATAVSFTVANTGVIAADASTSALYLSTDNSITSADIRLAGGATPSIASLGADPESIGFSLPTDLTPGTYFLGVVADDLGQVTEFNENNDVSATVQLIVGNNTANTLTGTSLGKVMFALGGDDSLNGGAGADTMVGGTGDDTYSVDNAGDLIVENSGEGTDLVMASVSHTLQANVENLTLTGTAANSATGNALANVITGNAGNNLLAGLGGADTINGGDGLDTSTYAASPGGVNISLATGAADGGDAQGDVLSNVENLTGSAFNDTLEGDAGNNVLVGGAGVDMLTYVHATAAVTVSLGLTTAQNTGSAGIDTLSQFEGLTGTAFSDTITGSNTPNILVGLDGDDSIVGGGGADTMVGGLGDDTYSVDSTGDVITENPGEGTDLVLASASHTLGANVENLTLVGTAAIKGTGNAGGNVILGNAANNVLSGMGGADTLNGGDGLDTAAYAASPLAVNLSLATSTYSGGDADGDVLSNIENLTGSAFNDTLEGDAGPNVLNGGNGVDMLSYAHATAAVSVSLAIATAQATGGGGIDTVSQFENLTGSAFGDTLTGSSGGNLILGLDGNDSIVGGGGADTMVGGAGDDIYSVDHSSDLIVENAGEGVDLVIASVSHTLEANLENLTLVGTSAINGTGNSGGNVVLGNAANNVLAGLGGADTIDGADGTDTASYAASGAGVNLSLATSTYSGGDAQGDVLTNIENLTGSAFDDVIEGDGGANVLVGGGGIDTLTYVHATGGVSVNLATTGAQATGGAGIDTISQFENLTGSAFGDTLTGSNAPNILTGLDGADSLSGATGTDTLVGGAGDDTLVGGSNADYFVYADGPVPGGSGLGVDTIMDFSHSTGDKLDLSGLDANTGVGGDQAFTFIGANSFHGIAGELRFATISGGVAVMGDTNGDGLADFTINLNAVTTLVSTDFIL